MPIARGSLMRKFGASSRVPFSHQLDGGEFASEHGRYSAEKRKRDRDRNFAQHEMFATWVPIQPMSNLNSIISYVIWFALT